MCDDECSCVLAYMVTITVSAGGSVALAPGSSSVGFTSMSTGMLIDSTGELSDPACSHPGVTAPLTAHNIGLVA